MTKGENTALRVVSFGVGVANLSSRLALAAQGQKANTRMSEKLRVSSQQLGDDLFEDFVLKAQQDKIGRVEKFAKQCEIAAGRLRNEDL